MTKFVTAYKTAYTTPLKTAKKAKFTTRYSVKNTTAIISGDNRPEGLKFKSRLVSE